MEKQIVSDSVLKGLVEIGQNKKLLQFNAEV